MSTHPSACAIYRASVLLAETKTNRSTRAAETPGHAWHFFVEHYQDETQARRDPAYTYELSDGSYYYGLDPPDDAVP